MLSVLRRTVTLSTRTTSASFALPKTPFKRFSTMSDTSAENPITIDVISDAVCPWCYVGVTRMEQAFKEASVNPEVKWHPFFLNRPGTGPTGTPINEYLANKYGAGMVARASKALESAGSELGIKFNNERLMCDTLKAHILTDYARKFNKESEMAKAIFKSYFEDAQNIDNVDALVKIAEQVGLDGEDVRKLLRSGDGEEEVYNEVKEYAQKYRVTGVPYFIVSKKNMKKKFVFSGAQDKEFWLEAIEQAQDIKD